MVLRFERGCPKSCSEMSRNLTFQNHRDDINHEFLMKYRTSPNIHREQGIRK